MNIFCRDFKNLEDEAITKEQIDMELKKLRDENFSIRDIAAICIAMFQILLPFVLGIGIIYFLIIGFMIKVWFK